MPSRKIQFRPGEFYHIYNRGYARQNIFFSDHDRYRFLQAMYLSNNENSPRSILELERDKSSLTLADIERILAEKNISYNPLVRVCADCLMPNHFHFLIEEIKENGIVKFMQKLGVSYARYFSIKYDKPGSIFQGRFKAVQIKSDDQLRYLLLYINAMNPAQIFEPGLKENGIRDFENIWEKVNSYKWSTHPEFCELRKSILVDKGLAGELFDSPENYKKFIEESLREKSGSVWQSLKDFMIEE